MNTSLYFENKKELCGKKGEKGLEKCQRLEQSNEVRMDKDII